MLPAVSSTFFKPLVVESVIFENDSLFFSGLVLLLGFSFFGIGADTVALSPASLSVSSNIPNHSKGFLKNAGNLCNFPLIQFFNLSFQLPSGDNDLVSSFSPPNNHPANTLNPLTSGPPPTKARTPSPRSLKPSPILPPVNASQAIPNLFIPPIIGRFMALSDMYCPMLDTHPLMVPITPPSFI